MKFKHWLLSTLGLFALSVLIVIVSGGNKEGIQFTLFTFVCVLMFASGVMTILSAISSIFKLMRKGFANESRKDISKNNLNTNVDSTNSKNEEPLKFDNFEKQTIAINQEYKPVTQRGNINLIKCQIDNEILESLKKCYISFDVETTGLSPQKDRIIEIGAVVFESGMIVKKYKTLVNPNISISKSATAVNHITNEMIKDAPSEDVTYREFVEFLGNALNQETILCAHNASFDMNFLSETLMRLGYSGCIRYIDTLQLSRRLIKGLDSYKQDNVAKHFGFINEQSHRAVSDAEVCGKILWELLDILDKDIKREEDEKQRVLEINKLTDVEKEICAYIQHCIIKNGGDSKYLGFHRNSSNYVDVCYLYTVLKFKCSKKGNYLIAEKSKLKPVKNFIEPCTMSEGGTNWVRVFFNNPFELDALESYIFDCYEECRNSALEYFEDDKKYEIEYKNGIAMHNKLSDEEVQRLISILKKRNEAEIIYPNSFDSEMYDNSTELKDIQIHPVNDRVPFSEILNKEDWEKGYDQGHGFWEQGEKLRKEGKIDKAILLYDEARYHGYNAPALYESYAMAFHKLKDYDNEIDILNEALARGEKSWGIHLSKFNTKRIKAIELLNKQHQAEQKKTIKNQIKDINSENTTKKVGRVVLQYDDDMNLIKSYESISQAVRETGINSKSIRDAANGVQKHAGGYVWRYGDEDDT